MNFIRKHSFNLLLILIYISFLVLIWLSPSILELDEESIYNNTVVQALLTLVLTFSFIFIFNLKSLIRKKTNKNSLKQELKVQNHLYKTQVAKTYNTLNLAFQIWGKEKDLYLKKLPWFIMIGESESGRSSFLENTALDFSPMQMIAKEIINKESIWRFSREAVILDIPSQDENHDDDKLISSWGIPYTDPFWGGLFKFILQNRANNPVNGIIVTMSLPGLMLQTSKQHQMRIQSLKAQLKAIQKDLNVRIPIYFVMTKMDLLAGFQDYFRDLSAEDREQVYGITIPENLALQQSYFADEFDRLIKRLQDRLFLRLENEREPEKKRLLSYFPQQLELFKYILSEYIVHDNDLSTRAIFFVSNHQGDLPHDFIMSALSHAYHLPNRAREIEPYHDAPFFTKRLFHDVILHDKNLLRLTAQAEISRARKIKVGFLIMSALFLMTSIGLSYSYFLNKKRLQEMEQVLPDYQDALDKFQNKSLSLDDLVVLLDKLQVIYDLYNEPTHQLSSFEGILPYQIKNRINQVRQNILRTQYLEKVKLKFENLLKKYQNKEEILYFILKGYLAFDTNYGIEKNSVLIPLTLVNEAKLTNKENKTLFYLNEALRNPIKLDPSSFNGSLIQNSRKVLNKNDPVHFAYYELKYQFDAKGKEDNLLQKLSADFSSIFKLENEKLQSIPELYTLIGYKDLYSGGSKRLGESIFEVYRVLGIEKDEKDVIVSKQISPTLWRQYNNDYLKHWSDYLANIHIKEFKTLSDAIETIDTLIKKDAFLPILDMIKLNTYTVRGNKLTVANQYAKLNAITGLPLKRGDQYKELIKNLQDLQVYLVNVSSAPDVSQNAFEEASVYLQNKSQSNPIRKLKRQALLLPEPLKSWVNEIADASLGVILKDAKLVINEAWQSNVYAYYQTNLLGRFPFDRASDRDADINAFAKFFGLKGIYNQFLEKYITPFIDVSSIAWKPYQSGKYTIGIRQAQLQELQRLSLISRSFFQTDEKMPSVNFSIKPRYLDAQTSFLLLQIGAQTLNYQHGPEQVKYWKWYSPQDLDQVVLSFSDFNNEAITETYDGPWGLYKLLARNKVTRGSSEGQYILSIKRGPHEAVFDLIAMNDSNVFDLNLFTKLKLSADL